MVTRPSARDTYEMHKTKYKELPTVEQLRKFFANSRNFIYDPVLETENNLLIFLGTTSQEYAIEELIQVYLKEIRSKMQ